MRHMKRFMLVALVTAVAGGLLAVRYRANERAAEPSSNAAARSSSPHTMAVDQRGLQLIGVQTAVARRGTLPITLRAGGTVQYDEARLTDINLKLEGWINDLYVNYVGQPVKKGQPLFALFSPELLDVENELFVGLRNRDQARSTGAPGTSTPDFGERVVDVPRQKLLRWDVPAETVRELEESRRIQSAIEFRSPTDGVVIERTAVKGMHVERGQSLYRIADLSVVWIETDFREVDLSDLRLGAKTTVVADAWPGRQLTGTIGQVYPYVTESTRSVKARVSVANPDGKLKPGMFVNVEVHASPKDGIRVPADAVLDSGRHQVVFVAKGQGRFEPREVTVGSRTDGQAVIVDGLQENEVVATRAAFFLDSETSLRAALEHNEAAAPSREPAEASRALSVNVQSPGPARTGENVLEVLVQDASSQPITDADVRVTLSMPAMPSMNMPAMHSDARLTHVAKGVYRGPAMIQMAGRWDMTVSVLRDGRHVAETHSSLLAR